MAAGTVGSFLAFLFNVFLTRKLSYADYGVFTSLISFFGLITIPAQAITTSIIQYATQYFSRNEINKATSLYHASLRTMFIISGIVFLIFILLSNMFANFFHITSLSYLWLTDLLIGLTYFGVVNNAFLQSLLKFKFLAGLAFTSNLVRLLLGLLLITLGFYLFGALSSVILATAITILVGFFPLRFLLHGVKEIALVSKRDVFQYSLSAAIISLSLTSFTSTDIILVKHFFNSYDAGLYSGLSLVGKVIFYFTAPISTVLFPLIVKKYHQKDNFLKTFYLALLLVFLPSLAITCFYTIFPQFTISFFLGGKGYLYLIPYVGWYGLYLTVFSLLNVTITFLLSLKRVSIIFPMMLGASLQIIFINLFHKNFFQVILISLIITSILLLGILLYYVKNYEKRNSHETTPSLFNNPGI